MNNRKEMKIIEFLINPGFIKHYEAGSAAEIKWNHDQIAFNHSNNTSWKFWKGNVDQTQDKDKKLLLNVTMDLKIQNPDNDSEFLMRLKVVNVISIQTENTNLSSVFFRYFHEISSNSIL